ncbi:imidazole glycerol phosphate synthase subunit HisH [Roseivirga echinicomitans]|uniref:Imidazole glycerol phosphate synthase subunit HisH n=1 Tax=Roseivirga echinicomitans TaxID=296218 RepID=A0A150XVV4_9BACT|nr:imidazole glycerol phosphate synthase subunit HisH [Roseivirga echinicomitans]KYG82843.1 hypothetical protein AWN68_13745 [Roseivirga echinicomitans]
MIKVAVLDYGIGNVRSITNALNSIGAEPILTSDSELILSADALILPGVGAFAKGMQNLKDRNLVGLIHQFVNSGKPFLGICLGMQMLLDESEEFGLNEGLGLIKGKVVKLPLKLGNEEKLPHVSWNEILPPSHGRWNNTLLESTAPSSDVYFIHSYVALPADQSDVLSHTFYGDGYFCSAVQKDNITGFQFHPEKSGVLGLKMLSEFIESTRKINYESN